MSNERVNDLLLVALETELGGARIYKKALECVLDEGLRQELTGYLEETESQIRDVRDLCRNLGIDPERRNPVRDAVAHTGASLVQAMTSVQNDPEAAELVANECVLLAEMLAHQWWLRLELTSSSR